MNEKYETTMLPGDYVRNSIPYGSLGPTAPAPAAQVQETPAPTPQPQSTTDVATPSSSPPAK